MSLIFLVNRFLSRTGMPAARFGREAMGDPSFVRELREGREPRPGTVKRVCAYMRDAS